MHVWVCAAWSEVACGLSSFDKQSMIDVLDFILLIGPWGGIGENLRWKMHFVIYIKPCTHVQ